jgi:hypothetical protein
MNTGLRHLLLILAGLLLLTVRTSATVVDAAWSNNLVFQKDRIDTSRPSAGVEENLLLNVKKISGTDASLYTDLNYDRDFASPGHIHFEVTNAYLDWRNDSGGFTVRLGRQRNFYANTPVYLDGVRLEKNLLNRLILTAIGGRPVASRYQVNQYVTRIDSTDYDVTLRADYLFKSSRTGLIYQHRLTADKRTSRDIGLLISNDFSPRVYARGGGVYDIDGKDLRELQLTGSYQCTEKLLFDASLSKEAWKIDSSSLFERKIFNTYEEGFINGRYRFTREGSVALGSAIRRFNKDSLGAEILANASYGRYRLGLRQDIGFGGKVTRIDGGADLFLSALLRLGLNAGLTRYPVTGAAADTAATAYYSALKIDAGPSTGFWSVNLDLQGLRNRFYKYETRAYLTTYIHLTRFRK